MARFRRVIYDSVQGTARIGAGLDWDSVYEALEPHGVTVVGGRVPGVGVAGFTLGGGLSTRSPMILEMFKLRSCSGYSWKSNQHGLSLDNVLEYALVLPNGTFTRVTEASEPDLFFALRGGGNNFVSAQKLDSLLS
jgi:FAD/FMN-containing dehydrogenase